MPVAGTKAAYRPMPRDFVETFIRVGWGGIEAECRAHKLTIVRWINEAGRQQLVEARAEYVREQREKRGSRRSDYVLGRRLRAVAPREQQEA